MRNTYFTNLHHRNNKAALRERDPCSVYLLLSTSKLQPTKHITMEFTMIVIIIASTW